MTLNISRIAMAAAAAALITSCSKGDNGAATTNDGTEAGIRADGAQSTISAGGGLNDPSIFYVLDVASMGDSAKGALASTKGTSTEVRDFARMMVRDHGAMRAQGQALSKRLGIQAAPPPGDSLPAKLDSALSRLNAAAKGRDFDKAYIDHEVASHRELLTIAVAAMSGTQNSEIKNLIQNVAPMLQAHLDRAQAVQKDLQK